MTMLKNIARFKSNEDIMQIFALMSASVAMMSFGAIFAWTSPSIPKLLLPEYGITLEETSYLPVIAPLTMILMSPLYCIIMDVIGRKYTLLSCSILQITALLFIAFAGNKYILYATSRFISGIADACCFAVIPTYIAEVAKPRIRDLYGNAMNIFIYFGLFLMNCVGYFFDMQLTAFILLSVPIIFFITFIFMPESPYYCCMKGQMVKARLSLQKLYSKENVEGELKEIIEDVSRQMSESGSFKDLFMIKSNRKAFLIVNLVRSFQQLTGFTALLVYSQYIFQEISSDISSGVSAITISSLLFASTFIGNLVADRLGKTKAMVISSLGSGLSLLVLTTYFYFDIYTNLDTSNINYLPLICLVSYIIFFSLGLSMIPNSLIGELFSASIRSHAVIFTNIIFALYMASTTKLFHFLMSEFGLCVPFALFTVCCFISAIGCYLIVPNTQGKTLEEIQQILKGNTKQTNV